MATHKLTNLFLWIQYANVQDMGEEYLIKTNKR